MASRALPLPMSRPSRIMCVSPVAPSPDLLSILRQRVPPFLEHSVLVLRLPLIPFAVNGPIYLANVTPAATTNCLYSNAGSLYWAGNLVGGGAVGNWTSDGTNVWRAGGNVGIGTTSPGSLLSLNSIANFTTATSTFYSTGGVNLAAGCFAIAGNCLSLSNISGTLPVTNGGTGVSIPSVAGFPVETYGATGNGSTDDSAAIQSAINAACSARGGRIVLGSKIYALASGLTVNCSNVYLVGQGAGGPYTANPSAYTDSNNLGATVLKWTGSSGGTMVTFEPSDGAVT